VGRHHTNRKVGAVLFAVVALAATFLPEPPPASAHGLLAIAVPRQPTYRGQPGFDGVCDSMYSWGIGVSYGYPGTSYTPSRYRVLIAGDRLYICVAQVPRDASISSVGVELDTSHDGGTTPQLDDRILQVDENGVVTKSQGNGSAWTSWDPSGSAVTIMRDFPPGYFSAEFYFDLADIGGASPLSIDGIRVFSSVRGTDYGWPLGSTKDRPSTWADAWWGVVPSEADGLGSPALGMSRVTQGFEWDVSGATAYDLIAGKDTLARAQVFTSGRPWRSSNAHCEIRRPDRSIFSVPAVDGRGGTHMDVSNSQSRLWDPDGSFNCWIPGNLITQPGRYKVDLVIHPPGSPATFRLPIDDPVFRTSGPIRVFFQPSVKPPAEGSRPWGDDLTAAIPSALANFSRSTPIASDVGRVVIYAPGRAATRGFRYGVAPGVMTCPASTTTAGACSAWVSAQILDSMTTQNRWAYQQEAHDSGGHRDRYDYGYDMNASRVHGTWERGGSCAGFPAVATAGNAAAGGSWDGEISGFPETALVHELTHCLAAVRTDSPHSDGTAHSNTRWITLVNGGRLIHITSRTDVDTLWGQIQPTMAPRVGNSTPIFLEGWEWNDTRNTLATMPRPIVVPPLGAAAKGPLPPPMFHVTGVLGEAGNLTILHSERLDQPGASADVFPQGAYSLVFLDGVGSELGSAAFEPTVPDTHGPWGSDPYFSITEPLPAGSAKVEVRKGAAVLGVVPFTEAVPVVTGVSAVAAGDGWDVSWSAADPDGPSLSYNVFFTRRPGESPQLLVGGLTTTAYHFSSDVAPASTRARFVVQATDGYNESSKHSAPFTVRPKPPVAAIAAPATGSSVVGGGKVTLVGGGYDLTAGTLTGSRLVWRSDLDGFLGTGAQRPAALSVGKHQITLKATAPSGMTATDTINIVVLKDSDDDGMPDAYEAGHACLDPEIADGNVDTDSDGLSNSAERESGTDPCDPDGDGDGISDGDEILLGSDPTLADAPAPGKLFLSHAPVDLGTCPSPKPASLAMTTVAKTDTWIAGSDERWLSVTPSGTGSGTLALTASCKELSSGDHLAHVLIYPAGGQPVMIEVTLLG
jgi:hypothetical protein